MCGFLSVKHWTAGKMRTLSKYLLSQKSHWPKASGAFPIRSLLHRKGHFTPRIASIGKCNLWSLSWASPTKAEQQKEGSGTGAKFQTTHIIGQKGKKNFYLVGLKLGSAVKKLNFSSFFGLNSFRTNLNHADCKTEPLRSWQKRIHITTEHSTTGYYQSAQNPPATFLLPLAFISSLLLWIINNLVRPNHVDMGADLI